MSWYTVEVIGPGSWCISEYAHWEETHCYLLTGAEKALLLDTGLGIGNIREQVDRLTALPVQVLTTHAHWDHIGGHREFEAIYVHEAEEEWLKGHFPLPLEAVKRNLTCRPCDFPKEFKIEDYRLFDGGVVGTVCDKEYIDLGGRRLQVMHTPGHSPGHICLWEEERQWLFSGDLLYLGCLDAFYPTTDPVAFCSSVERIAQLPVKAIWPGHHSLQVPITLPKRVAAAFMKLADEGKLSQGSGIFTFQDFQIHL